MKYVSELKELENKKFDTIEDLEKAEAEVKAAADKRAKEALVRKEDAGKVEAAFKERNAARKEYNESLNSLRKAYSEAIAKARDEFNAGLNTEGKKLEAKEQAFQTALDEFYKTHGNYHLTLKDDDNEITIVRTGDEFEEYLKPIKDYQEAWKNWINDFFRF